MVIEKRRFYQWRAESFKQAGSGFNAPMGLRQIVEIEHLVEGVVGDD